MKSNSVFTALALAASLVLAPFAWAQQYDQTQQRSTQQQRPTQMQPGQPEQAQQRGKAQQSMNLTEADELKDMKIQTTQGEELGSIDKVIVDTQQGKVAYVVVSTGGAWGIGGEKAMVPWNAFRVQQGTEPDEQILVLNVQKEQLKNAPQGDFEETAFDREQARQIHQFYGVSPYWEEGAPGMEQRQMMREREHMPQQQKDQMRQDQPTQRQQSQ